MIKESLPNLRKKKGRFLKKNSSITKSIQVKDYSFAKISENQHLIRDNRLKSVFFMKMDPDREIDAIAKLDGQQFEDLSGAAGSSKVIEPKDFSHQNFGSSCNTAAAGVPCENVQVNQSSLPLGGEDQQNEKISSSDLKQRGEGLESKRGTGGDFNNFEPMTRASVEDIATSHQKCGSNQENERLQEPETPISQEELSNQLNRQALAPEALKDSHQHDQAQEIPTSDVLEERRELGQEGGEDSHCQPGEINVQLGSERFVEDQVQNEPLAEEEKMPTDQNKHWQRGFDEGFDQGKSMGLVEAREELKPVLRSLESGLQENEVLRRKVLSQAQENFLTVSQAINQALFQRMLEIDPKIFRTFVSKVINETIKDGKHTISVNPELLKHLEEAGIKESEKRWIADESIKNFQFRIESDSIRVESSLAETIEAVIKELDLNLFIVSK